MYMNLVYYAPREEKTGTVHSSCKLPPEPKARVANTSCGLANFIPVVCILFFAIPGPKTPHSRFGAERECGTFGQGVAKNLFLQFLPCNISRRSLSSRHALSLTTVDQTYRLSYICFAFTYASYNL